MSDFPMSIPQSGDIDDGCFRIWNNDLLASGKRLSIRINGEEAKRVTRFDADAGWVEWQRHDEHGRPILVAGQFDLERVEGKITVAIVTR